MELTKERIEQEYANAVYFNLSPSKFASKILELLGKDDKRETRTALQNRARWQYLTFIASELNDRGETFEANGIDIPIMYNKDILYNVYWQTSKGVLFPNKKGQLSTAEFSKLTNHVQDLFAYVFDVHIPFPNIQDLLNKRDLEEGRV